MSFPCFPKQLEKKLRTPEQNLQAIAWCGLRVCLSPRLLPPPLRWACSSWPPTSFPQTLRAHLHLGPLHQLFLLPAGLFPYFATGWFHLIIHASMSPSQSDLPDDATPSPSPSHLCSTFLFALIGSGYFLVHQFCCGGCLLLLLFFIPTSTVLKQGPRWTPLPRTQLDFQHLEWHLELRRSSVTIWWVYGTLFRPQSGICLQPKYSS